ncbi:MULTISPECIES: hypothetical protein [unclassified Saccharothrix]|uniref:hypothetical protein n=1 Tax=unclassified Saccharothrix TaxID=2593673 RepID=UPI00307CF3F1
MTAGLIASTPGAATAATWPVPYVRVGENPISVEISPNGALAYVTNAEDRTVSAIDTASKTVTATIPVGIQPEDVAFTPDSRRAYITNAGDSNTDKGSVSVIDTAAKQVVSTVSVAAVIAPRAVAVTPDGTKAYVVGSGYEMSVIDTATNTATPVHIGRSGATDVKVTPDGSRVYIADFYSKRVVVVSTATNSVIANVPLPTAPNRIAIMPDGLRAYATSYQADKVYMIATAGNYVAATVSTPNPLAVAPAPNGRQVHVADYDSNTMSSIDVATNTVLGSREIGMYAVSMAITRTGTEAYVVLRSNYSVVIRDIAAEPGRDRVVAGERLEAGQSKTSPDGRYRLTMQTDGNLVLYNANNQAVWHTHTNGTGATYAVLQYDGNFVVYAPHLEAKWHTNTWSSAADRFVVQNDSNLVLYGPNGFPHWHRW